MQYLATAAQTFGQDKNKNKGTAMATSGFSSLPERIQDALREIAILLMAFSPLDVALSMDQRRTGVLVVFLSLGVGLFILSRAVERIRETQKTESAMLHFVSVGVLSFSVFVLLLVR